MLQMLCALSGVVLPAQRHVPRFLRVHNDGIKLMTHVHGVRMSSSAITKARNKEMRKYLRQLDDMAAKPCEGSCTEALHQLSLIRDEGLPLHVHAQTKVMLMCGDRLHAVQSLFEELRAAGIENEASCTALLRSQVRCGELSAAMVSLLALLDDRGATVRLRTCAPLLISTCEANEQLQAMRLWQRVQRRGVAFTPREYCAMLRMHGRMGAGRQLWPLLGELLEEHPHPDDATIAGIRSSLHSLSSSAPDQTVQISEGASEDGRCNCCGKQLQLLRITAQQCEAVRKVLLERAAARSHSSRLKLLSFDRCG